ncbi:MAG: hypothetical protein JWM47_747 [Acidimicrobiales bacterium]|nr:hypothetical protein [Acidimicrobiales bacterium]
MRHRLLLASGALLLVTACGASGDSEGATTTTKAEAAPTTGVAKSTTTEPDEIDGAQEFQAMVEDMDAAIDAEAIARDGAAAENDLATALAGISDLRDELFDFDGDLRDLGVDDAAVESVNAVLEADGAYIELLDEYNGITEISRYNELLDKEPDVRDGWEKAVNEAAEELGVDGVEAGLAGEEPAGDDGGSTTPDNAGLEAGETITSTTASMEVPEGFTGTNDGPMGMVGPNGATLGLFTVSGEAGEDLSDVAKDFVEGAADKNGYEITGGPEDTPVGDYEGVAYYYDYGDGTVAYDIFFEAEDGAGTRFHVLTLEASEDDAEELVAAVNKVLSTITIG